MKTDELIIREKCCGCRLCAYECPKQAITIVSDENGFAYPEINEAFCIDCKKCVRKCPEYNEQQNGCVSIYASVNKNENQLLKSASGGAFAEIAKSVLTRNGVVYGCAYEVTEEEILKVKHIRVDNEAELIRLQGSKYVQSDISEVFAQIKSDVENEKEILFSGTPCQVASVKSEFGGYDKLILVDIICHGVPSQKMFSDYLSILQQKAPTQKTTDFSFRDKQSGWGMCAKLELTDNNGNKKYKSIPCNISSYFKMFLNCEIYRESCYSCKYATDKRVGDITLGDYWGIQKNEDLTKALTEQGFELTKGISCVLVNSEKGKCIVEQTDLLLFESDFEDVARENFQLQRPSILPESRKTVIELYLKNGYQALENRFNKALGFKKYLYVLRNKIPAKLRMKIRVLLHI